MRDGAPNMNMKDLFEPVRSAWTPQRAAEVRARVDRGLAGRRRRVVATRLLVGGAGLTALVLAGLRAGPFAPPAEPVIAEAAPVRPIVTPLTFDDGSRVTPLSASDVVIVASEPRRKLVRVRRGGARFEVVPSKERVFRVEAGAVAVEVLGTSFAVEQVEPARANVAVSRGKVRVLWQVDGAPREALLVGGESGTFPPVTPTVESLPPRSAQAATPAEDGTATPETSPAEAPAAESPEPRAQRRPRATWRALAQRGRFDDAYRALEREGPASIPDEPGALLAAADVARLSHHPAEAATRFRAVIARYPRDPRASLAAFHLGLVLLEELARPREAAAAFARCRRLDPGGDLVEDALGREVEALFRAGDSAAAREAAELYLRRHPNGRRANAVRGYGGLR